MLLRYADDTTAQADAVTAQLAAGDDRVNGGGAHL